MYICNMENEKMFVKLDSVDTYNKLYGLETHYPLATVINLNKATKVVNHIVMDYGVYAIYLKKGINCTLQYGRQSFDYQKGTIVSFSPGQVVGYDSDKDELAPDVIGLMFHPDLIYGTPLGEKISTYTFFDYSQRESLHLSESEKKLFIECLERIQNYIRL